MSTSRANFYIVKQFIPNAQVWVVKLNGDDNVYEYNTSEEAEAALVVVQPLYPNNQCRVQAAGDTIFI
jgi:hypothetical protein